MGPKVTFEPRFHIFECFGVLGSVGGILGQNVCQWDCSWDFESSICMLSFRLCAFSRAELKGTNQMEQTGFCKNLRFSAKFCGFLRFSAKSMTPKYCDSLEKTVTMTMTMTMTMMMMMMMMKMMMMMMMIIIIMIMMMMMMMMTMTLMMIIINDDNN